MKRFARWLWRLIAEDSAAEIIDREFEPQVLAEMLQERAQALIASTNVPTVDEAWLCLDCGAVQGEATNFRCCICGRSQLIDVTTQLQGAVRIRRKSSLRKVPRL